MKKKGFTLVELLVSIVIIALIAIIIVPNVLKASSSAKQKSYDTKIAFIEQAGNNYGTNVISDILEGNSSGEKKKHTCSFTYEKDKIKDIKYTENVNSTNSKDQYSCERITVGNLVEQGYLLWDETNYCGDLCVTNEDKEKYDSVVLNPINNNIINNCYVYMYYKDNDIYTEFDKSTCDGGLEYSPIKGSTESTTIKTTSKTEKKYSFKITYSLNGGVNNIINPDGYDAGDEVIIVEPSRKGYIFLGWTGSVGDVPVKNVVISNTDREDKYYEVNKNRNKDAAIPKNTGLMFKNPLQGSGAALA